MEFRSARPDESPAVRTLFASVFSQSEGEQEGALIGRLAEELMACTDSQDLYGFVAVDREQMLKIILPVKRCRLSSGCSGQMSLMYFTASTAIRKRSRVTSIWSMKFTTGSRPFGV